MADIRLTATPPLGGADIVIGENRILERADLALVTVAIPLGGETAVADRLSGIFGLAMPKPTRSTASGELRAMRTAPDQIILILPAGDPGREEAVAQHLAGTGYTTRQTDAWVILEVSGPATAAALERLCMLDLAPQVFPPGASGRTLVEHLSVLLLRLDADRYLMLSASSSARSFLHAVETSYRHAVT